MRLMRFSMAAADRRRAILRLIHVYHCATMVAHSRGRPIADASVPRSHRNRGYVMASIFKRRATAPIPAGAKIVTKAVRGQTKRVAVWSEDGRERQAPLTEDGTKIITKEAATFTCQFIDSDGKLTRRSTGSPDRQTAEQIAAKLEADSLLRRKGLIDPHAEALVKQAARAIDEHIQDFRQALTDRGCSLTHVTQTIRQLRRIVADASIASITDISAASVMRAVGMLRQAGCSHRWCNSHITAARSFSRWLHNERRSTIDALAGIGKLNEQVDKRHRRRVLSDEELSWLLAETMRQGRTNYGLCAVDRMMAYSLACGTGLRVSELRSLTPSSFNFNNSPSVKLQAAHSKRRREDSQPLDASLAQSLATWMRDKPADERLFRLPHNTSRMLQRDLAWARDAWIDAASGADERARRSGSDFLAYRNASGEVADFHAFRACFISRVVASGASIKVAQELARHSTPVLTLNTYAKVQLSDVLGSVPAVPLPDQTQPPGATQGRVHKNVHSMQSKRA